MCARVVARCRWRWSAGEVRHLYCGAPSVAVQVVSTPFSSRRLHPTRRCEMPETLPAANCQSGMGVEEMKAVHRRLSPAPSD